MFSLLLFATSAFGFFENLNRTTHTYECDESFEYAAVTGSFPVLGDSREEFLEIFFIGYFKEDEPNRPITFVFPGGPGGAGGTDAISTFGPKRILTVEEGKKCLPPYRLIDNPESLLPHSDLVFIDPIGTGFSTQELEFDQQLKYFDTDGDIRVLGDFVHTFISNFNRWNSPKYLSGISYGSTRCAALAEYLTCEGFSIHGIVLLGSAIDFSTLIGQHNRFLPDSLLIPTFAATAWYHGRLFPELSLAEVISKAKNFVYQFYLPAMLQPKLVDSAFYGELSMYLGLPEATVRRFEGRFNEQLYTREFYGNERKVIGGLDTRKVGHLATNREIDPSYLEMQGIYCAFNQYLQNDLNTKRPLEKYISFSNEANYYWNFSTFDSVEFPEFIQRIQRTLIFNPEMKVYVGSGYYDARTPFAATDYSFDHIGLPSEYEENIIFEYFEGGHGFVFDLPCLRKLKNDLSDFFPRRF